MIMNKYLVILYTNCWQRRFYAKAIVIASTPEDAQAWLRDTYALKNFPCAVHYIERVEVDDVLPERVTAFRYEPSTIPEYIKHEEIKYKREPIPF